MACLMVLSTFASAQNDAYVYPDGTYKVLTGTSWTNIYFKDGGVQVDNSEVQPYTSFSEIFFTKLSTAAPKIRMNNDWNGEIMPAADGTAHYHYKGFIPTNNSNGSIFNFYDAGGTIMGPDIDQVNTKIIETGTTYALKRHTSGNNPDLAAFILPPADNAPLPASEMPAAMLDFDLTFSDANGAQLTVNRIENPKLFATGGFTSWKREDQVPNPVYLTETEPGSMIFQGKISTSNSKEITLFAPRYMSDPSSEGSKYDWLSQRITTYADAENAQTHNTNVTIDATNKWIVGMKPWGGNPPTQGGWELPELNTPYVVTVDLRHSDRTKNRIMVQPLTQTVNVGSALWASYAPSFKVSTTTAVTNGANTQLRYVTLQDNRTDIERPSIAAGQTLQRGEGILIKSDRATTVTFTYDPEGTPVTLEGNHMRGVIDDPIGRPTDCTPYLLANKSHGLAFYLWDPESSNKLAVNKSYLAMPQAQALPTFYGLDDETETAIEAIQESAELQADEMYNLSGQRIQRMQRGVNIVNGKKVLY